MKKRHKSSVSQSSDSLSSDTHREKSRARSDLSKREGQLWHRTHPICKRCKEPCKQRAAVQIIRCPHFVQKEEEVAP